MANNRFLDKKNMTVVITSIRRTFDGVSYFCYLNTSPNKCQLLIAKHSF